jgi:hypothetical protein
MSIIFNYAAPVFNPSFGAGLFPQVDNTVARHVVSAADLDEVTAWSIAREIAEIETARRELEYDRIVEEENRAAYDRFMDELADERDAEARVCLVCVA